MTSPARDNTFNYRIRAGLSFSDAGYIKRAWPILLEATTFDWNAAGIPEDDHMTEWAFSEMLRILAQASDREGFAKLFWQAVARCNELDAPFPRNYSLQDLLLGLCQQLGLARELGHVIERIETLRPVSRTLARRLAEVKGTR